MALAFSACEQPASEAKNAIPASVTTTKSSLEAKTTEASSAELELPWHHDDYAAALAQAKKENKSLVIDLWAPWCHTCVSMQNTVLKRPGITKYASKFVWLALDTDKPVNEAVLKKITVPAWPTFYVFSPAEKTLARHVGGASTDEFERMLKSALAVSAGGLTKGSANSLVTIADNVSATGDHAAAAVAYRAALDAAGGRSPDRFALRVDLVASLYKDSDVKGCLKLADAFMDDQGSATSAAAADFIYYAVSCAIMTKDEAVISAMHERAIGTDSPLLRVLANPKADLTADDRSDALRMLREEYDALKQPTKAKKAALLQRKVLDDAVAKLEDPERIAGYAWPREEVYVYLGQGEQLVEELTRSVNALPQSYDPPYRLAWLLNQIGRSDEARLHAKDAIKKVYGNRTLRAWSLLASIENKRGNVADERAAWNGLRKSAKTLPESARTAAAISQANKNLVRLGPK